MRKTLAVLATAVLLGSGVTAATGTGAAAAPAPQDRAQPRAQTDEMPNPMEDKRRAMRRDALAKVLKGEAKTERRGPSTVTKLGTDSGGYVELRREKTDKVFVVLAEFGDERHPNYPDQDTDPQTPGPVRFDGPLHNQIPAPDRAVDNTTIWRADHSRQYYQDTYFSTAAGANSVANYYNKQSSGRYGITGTVTDWVKVRYNQARYGRSNGYPCPNQLCSNFHELVRDGVNAWVAQQKAAGRTPEQIRAQLAEYDTWDRYDSDGDGDFNEPDGYLDHFQIVKAGGDQADGDPSYGEDAIWSNRGYAFKNFNSGPANNKRGGAQIADTGLWVGDYTMQSENGGVSTLAHEYAHDLGLPDEYDFNGGNNGVNWWSLMAQMRVGVGNEPPGTRPNEMSAWDKLQLGWLDYEVAVAGQTREIDLGPHEYNSAKAQGLVVVLPDLTKTSDYGNPLAGSKMWWSDWGNDLDNSMTTALDLTGKQSASFTLKARFDTEDDSDFVYFEAQNADGSWTPLDGTVDGRAFRRDSSDAPTITGSSGGKWVDVKVPLDAYAGKNTKLRIAYRTDMGYALAGFFADEMVVTADGTPILTDGAESAGSWTLKGFRATTGKETKDYDQFYVASNRTYESYGKYNKTGPYRFSFPDKPRWVEHFPYQAGLVVSLWDTSYLDNSTSLHPGEGMILPIDAHPVPLRNENGLWSASVSGYDAPFGLVQPDSFTLHLNGKEVAITGQPAQPLFDDTRPYWYPEAPGTGVKLRAVGVGLQVLSQKGTSMRVRLFPTK